MLWHASDRPPSWADWHAWATLMRRAVMPSDLRRLRRIYDAYHQPPAEESSRGN